MVCLQMAKLEAPASLSVDWHRMVYDAAEDARTLAKGVTQKASEQQQRVLPTLVKYTEDFVVVAKRNGIKACAETKV